MAHTPVCDYLCVAALMSRQGCGLGPFCSRASPSLDREARQIFDDNQTGNCALVWVETVAVTPLNCMGSEKPSWGLGIQPLSQEGAFTFKGVLAAL